MQPAAYEITFPGIPAREQEILAGELEKALRKIPGATVDRQPSVGNNMDFGASIAVIFGTAAAVQIAKGIQSWLAGRTVTIDVQSKDKKVILKGVSRNDAARLLEIAVDS